MVCLAVTLERVEGMHVPLAAQAASASKGAASGPDVGPSPVLSRSSALSRSSLVPGSPLGKKPALGGLLGRVLPGRSRSRNGRRLDRSLSINSTISDDMLAGEDPGDECEWGWLGEGLAGAAAPQPARGVATPVARRCLHARPVSLSPASIP